MNSELYFGGLPTEPEIKKLEALFPDIAGMRGTTIPHEIIEEALKLSRDSSRYRTITMAWRKKIYKACGVGIRGDLREIVGVGFRVLSDSEQTAYGVDVGYRGARMNRRGHSLLANTDDSKLTEQEKLTKQHGMLRAAHIHSAYIESRRFLPKVSTLPEVMTRPEPKA